MLKVPEEIAYKDKQVNWSLSSLDPCAGPSSTAPERRGRFAGESSWGVRTVQFLYTPTGILIKTIQGVPTSPGVPMGAV